MSIQRYNTYSNRSEDGIFVLYDDHVAAMEQAQTRVRASMTRVGSLFTGYGGLDMAVGGDLAWYSEIDPAACTVLEAHHSDVPNLGDITQVDWGNVPPVDVLTGGYPCQPFSHAGKRQGSDDERHLWPYVRDAIDALRPGVVVLENVRGQLTLGFGDVLADLSRVGYDTQWGVVRASDAGAPHSRARVFITAHPASIRREGHEQPHRRAIPDRYTTDVPLRMGGTVRGRLDRWAGIVGRPCPPMRYLGSDGVTRIDPRFPEWLMGLPQGHVTGHGLRPAQELKLCGNGVVPQQAALALAMLT